MGEEGISTKAIPERAIIAAGFKKAYKKAFRVPLSSEDLDDLRELCNDKTEIIVAGGDKTTGKVILYARDNCKNALQVTKDTKKAHSKNERVYWYNINDNSFGFAND